MARGQILYQYPSLLPRKGKPRLRGRRRRGPKPSVRLAVGVLLHLPLQESAMSASPDVPLTITPEAAARVAELGMQKELEQMIAQVRRVVPDLAAIEVE